jgi:phage/conjugal plasmid C-4 type zinc finger TraR family protein
MMDIVDQAQVAETLHRDCAVAAHYGRAAAAAAPATHCEEPGCGALIPEARRRAIPGVSRCVECQTLIEHRSRMGGR